MNTSIRSLPVGFGLAICFGIYILGAPVWASETSDDCHGFVDVDFNGHFSEELGERLYRRGFYPEAMTAWKCAFSEEGDAGAAFRLAVEYLDAKIVEKSAEKALEYLLASAFRGDGRAQFELGTIYDDGEIVDADPGKSMLWYFAASREGHPAAEFSLAVTYEAGVLVSADPVMAYAYYHLAHSHGFPVLAKESMERLDLTMPPRQRALAIRSAERIQKSQKRSDIFGIPKTSP